MYHATGSGEVNLDPVYSSPGMIKASMFNFDFDDLGRALKEEHARFLRDRVVSLLAKNRGQAWMQGSASRIGNAAYNKDLSRDRVSRVASFLLMNGVSSDQLQLEAIGAEMTTGHALDDRHDRAVALVVLPKAIDRPKPPPVVPAKPKVSKKFQLSYLSGVSAAKLARLSKLMKLKVGAGVAVDVSFFQIWDTTNHLACIYVYVGGGIGAGFPKLPWASATTRGPWNPFTTSAEISSSQFDGLARFTTAGVGPKSINFINLLGTPPGVDAVYMKIDTGTTLGAGASSTVGDFILVEGPDPFNGS